MVTCLGRPGKRTKTLAPYRVTTNRRQFFGAAALGILVNIDVATTEEQPSITFDGVGITSTYDPVEDALRSGAQRTGSIVTNRVVDRSLAIPPTINVTAGTRISVLISRTIKL